MVEYHRHSDAPAAPQGPISIAIIGVGGAGSNVLDRITLDRTLDASLVCMHTDVRVLGHAMAPTKLQLGTELMRGVGAGGDPDLGREAALFSRDVIRQTLAGHQIIFICAGLGGGTGSGAAPVIAEIAKSTGALVLVVATMPFSFEGRRRVTQAEEALELLQKRADALILFENNRMGELILPKDGIQKAFGAADQLISQSLRAVSTMISTPGLVKLGLDDLTASLAASNGRCLFGFGEARGQNRGPEALKKALKSPLIDQGRLLHHTKNLLVHVAGGESMTLVEVEGIMKQIGRNVPDHTQILFGVAVEPKLGDAVAVTLISSLGAEALQSYSQAQAATRLEPQPPLDSPPPVRNQPVAKPAAKATPRPPLPTADDDEMEEAAAPPVAEVTPKASRAADAFDLFAAATASAVATAPAAIAPAATAETVMFREVKEDSAVRIDAEIPDEVTFEEAGMDTLKPEVEAMEEEFQPEPEPASQPQPEVVAPVAETTSIPLPIARPKAESVIRSRTQHVEPVETAVLAPETTPEPPQQRSESVLSNVIVGQGQNASKTPAADKDMFQAGDEGRGRFKNTEPSLVEGEDLDVPTWMRLRKKLQR